MPTLITKRSKAAPVARKGKTAKTGASRSQRAAKPVLKKPDMKAWAAQRLASLKEQYGERIVPSSDALWDYLRSDASCPPVSIPASL